MAAFLFSHRLRVYCLQGPLRLDNGKTFSFVLTYDERAILLEALAFLRQPGRHKSRWYSPTLGSIEGRVRDAEVDRTITVGVHGGQVQWAQGNRFPVRVMDYDGDAVDLPDEDDFGDPCRIWFEPADKHA